MHVVEREGVSDCLEAERARMPVSEDNSRRMSPRIADFNITLNATIPLK